MQQLVNDFIQSQLHRDPAAWEGTQLLYVLSMFLVGGALTTFAAVFSGVVSWWERRVAGRMQSRIGPNRAGPAGFFIWLADAIKCLSKEDLIPGESDKVLFRFAPYLVVAGLIGTFVVLPFGHSLIAADMNVGLFYLASVTALSVVGILMSGWSSNSKWSLFGGMRAAAQVVSYEIPAGLALLIPVLMSGSLSMQQIIRAQGGDSHAALWLRGGMPWNWYAFANPIAFLAMIVYFTAALAEGNRAPFDLPEAESELVAGYHSEYSGMRFTYYFLVEWANTWVIGAVVATLFLGGWQIPGVGADTLDAARGWTRVGYEALSLGIFVAKVLALVNLNIWIRWTMPRIRVDQMMNLCWKYLVPAGLLAMVGQAGIELLVFDLGIGPELLGGFHFVFFLAFFVIPVYFFAKRTAENIRATGDRVDLSNW